MQSAFLITINIEKVYCKVGDQYSFCYRARQDKYRSILQNIEKTNICVDITEQSSYFYKLGMNFQFSAIKSSTPNEKHACIQRRDALIPSLNLICTLNINYLYLMILRTLIVTIYLAIFPIFDESIPTKFDEADECLLELHDSISVRNCVFSSRAVSDTVGKIGALIEELKVSRSHLCILHK